MYGMAVHAEIAVALFYSKFQSTQRIIKLQCHGKGLCSKMAALRLSRVSIFGVQKIKGVHAADHM